MSQPTKGTRLENLGDSLEDKLLEDLGEDFLKDLPEWEEKARKSLALSNKILPRPSYRRRPLCESER